MKQVERTLSSVSASKVQEALAYQSNARAVYLSYLWAVAFTMLGFSTYSNLKVALPDLTVWANVWPRIVFNSLPFFLLAEYLKRSKRKPEHKLGR